MNHNIALEKQIDDFFCQVFFDLKFTLNAEVKSDGALQTADISPVTP